MWAFLYRLRVFHVTFGMEWNRIVNALYGNFIKFFGAILYNFPNSI